MPTPHQPTHHPFFNPAVPPPGQPLFQATHPTTFPATINQILFPLAPPTSSSATTQTQPDAKPKTHQQSVIDAIANVIPLTGIYNGKNTSPLPIQVQSPQLQWPFPLLRQCQPRLRPVVPPHQFRLRWPPNQQGPLTMSKTRGRSRNRRRREKQSASGSDSSLRRFPAQPHQKWKDFLVTPPSCHGPALWQGLSVQLNGGVGQKERKWIGYLIIFRKRICKPH